jgi:hypothetical protein
MLHTDIKPFCDKYGYKVTERFGEVHIKTKYEEWYFDENEHEDANVILHHRNEFIGKRGNNKRYSEYHKQFSAKMTPEELIEYLHQHETAKFCKFVAYKYSYNGEKVSETV